MKRIVVVALMSFAACSAMAEKIGEAQATGTHLYFFDDRCLDIKSLRVSARKLIILNDADGRKLDGCWWLDEADLINVFYPSMPSFPAKALRAEELRTQTTWNVKTTEGLRMQKWMQQ